VLFKDKLFELRQEAGMTQKAIAAKAGMSMLTYRNYEQGTRLPGVPTFMKLVKALGIPCEVFAECEDVALAEGKKKPAKTQPNRPAGRPSAKAATATLPAGDLEATQKKPRSHRRKET
jgi:transcriptional regulator with XRE-family HTH domain